MRLHIFVKIYINFPRLEQKRKICLSNFKINLFAECFESLLRHVVGWSPGAHLHKVYYGMLFGGVPVLTYTKFITACCWVESRCSPTQSLIRHVVGWSPGAHLHKPAGRRFSPIVCFFLKYMHYWVVGHVLPEVYAQLSRRACSSWSICTSES